MIMLILLKSMACFGQVPANLINSNKSGIEREKTQPAQNILGNGLCFTLNKGQIADMNRRLCPDILYKGETSGADIYLCKTGISYVYSNTNNVMRRIDEQVEELIKAGIINEMDEQKKKEELLQKEKIKIHCIDMDFINSNPEFNTINDEELEGYNKYYYAHCPNGILNVKQYNKVSNLNENGGHLAIDRNNNVYLYMEIETNRDSLLTLVPTSLILQVE